MALDVDKLKEKIEDKYGDLDDEMGCYINHNWLSVKDVVDLIDDCGDDASEGDAADRVGNSADGKVCESSAWDSI